MISIETENKVYKASLKKVFIHLRTIFKHKYWVFKYCRMCGITWQGITHDLSKFSPAEFLTNVKYVEEGISPIDIQKREIGFSFAWQHHKGHNPHHYEFWMDRFDDGCYVTRMPFKYSVEMLCDMLAANKAYLGKNATYQGELKWWNNQKNIRKMHPDCTLFLTKVIEALAAEEEKIEVFGEYIDVSHILNKDHLKIIYKSCSNINSIKYGDVLPTQIKLSDI